MPNPVLTPELLEGTGLELSHSLSAHGTQRLRVLILPELPKSSLYSLEEFETAMDAIGNLQTDLPSSPALAYGQEDIYFDHD